MHKTLLKCLGIVLFAIFLVACVGMISLNAGETKNTVPQNTQTHIPKYTLSVYQGKLALFARGYAMPVEIYDVYLDSLPKAEQEKIKNGISAENDTEIQKIIEDYTS